MFLARALLFLMLLCSCAAAQTSPGFIPGKPVCANYPSSACPPPANPLSLNQAFANKLDYPLVPSAVPGVGGVGFSGVPSVGNVPIATGPTAAAWGPLACGNLSNGSAGCSTPVGTSGAVLPLLNGANTWSALQKFNLNGASLPGPQTGAVLQIGNANGVIARIEIDAFAQSAHFSGVRADGTAASPTTLQSNNEIVSLNAFGYNGSAYVGPFGGFRCLTAQNWTPSASGTYCEVAVTANGGTTYAESVRFENDGGVTIPGIVAGGSQGPGTVNISGNLYLGGVRAGTTINSISCVLGGSCSITATATTMTEGVTGVLGGNPPEFLVNFAPGTLQGTGISTLYSPVLNFSPTAAPGILEGNTGGIEITGYFAGTFPAVQFDSYQNGNTGQNGRVVFAAANGTNVAPTALQNTQIIGSLRFLGYNGSTYQLAANFLCSATANFAGAVHPAACSLNGASFALAGNQSGPAWTTNGVQWVSSAATLNDTTSSGTVATVFDNFSGLEANTTTSAATYTNLYGWYFGLPGCSGSLTCTNIWALGAQNARIGGFSTTSAVTISALGVVDIPSTILTFGPGTAIVGGGLGGGDFVSNFSNVTPVNIPQQPGSGNEILNAYWLGSPSVQLVGYGGGPNTGVITLGGTDGGGIGGPGAITSNNLIGQLFFNSYNGTNWRIGSFIVSVSSQNWDVTNNGAQLQFYTNANGTNYNACGISCYIMFLDWQNGLQIKSKLAVTGASIFGTSVMIGSTTPLTLASGELGLEKVAASGSAPGTLGGKFALVCGTGPGTAKVIAYAGTSTTPVTIADNIGAGVNGC